MMKIIFSLLSFILLSMTLHAQNPIAQLKFEDAEKAFNEGDYEKALHYVEETETLAGVTSKTLYLKIVTQDKLVAGGQANLLSTLKTNVQKYLTAMASQEIDDKYRMVYEISKKLDDYAAGKNSSTTTNVKDSFTPSDKTAADILTAYRNAVIGNVNPESVQTIIIEKETTRNGSPISTTTLKKTIGKYFLEIKTNVISMKTVYNNGKGYMIVGSRQLPFSTLQMGRVKQHTSPGNLVPEIFNSKTYANATVSRGVYNGKQVDIIKLSGDELYFDRDTHLLIAQKAVSANRFSITIKYQDYTSYQGIKFPATVITETIIGTVQQVPGTSTLNQTIKQASPTASQGTAAIGLMGGSRKKKKKAKNRELALQIQQAAKEIAKSTGAQTSGNTTTEITKIISVKINEPIDDEVFK